MRFGIVSGENIAQALLSMILLLVQLLKQQAVILLRWVQVQPFQVQNPSPLVTATKSKAQAQALLATPAALMAMRLMQWVMTTL